MDNDEAKWNLLLIQLLAHQTQRKEIARRRSKPYWLADVLTFSRIGISLILFQMAFGDWGDVETALILFGIGELTDAFDGMAARKWLYPEDGRYRPWRVYASAIDQVADILLGISLISFVILRVNARIGLFIFLAALAIALPIQLARGQIEQKWGKKIRERVVLARRMLYVATIFGTLLWLVWLTAWDNSWKITISYLSITLIFLLILFKTDRLTQEKTPLVQTQNVPEFLRSH